MVRPRSFAWILLGATAFASMAFASGPFGISMGDRVWENPACRATSAFTYRCEPLPASEPLFDSYQSIVIIAPAGVGACQIQVRGPVLTRKQQREPGNIPMDEAARYLRTRYGENFKKYDVVPTDTEMAQPKMWWMSLLGDYRDYRYVWNPDSGFAPVDHVALIALQYQFVDEGPYVHVIFRFENGDECRRAVEAQQPTAP